MKFRVTGGADGQSGISVGTRRYEPGDTIELTQSKAEWLIERGLLEPEGRRTTISEPQPAPEDIDTDDDLVDEPADDTDADITDESEDD